MRCSTGGTVAALAALAIACDHGDVPDAGADTGAPPVDAALDGTPAGDADDGRALAAWAPGDHPIDLALWPRLVREGATDVSLAGEDELCRRFAVTLMGRVPTIEERAALCAGRDAEAIARAMMDRPAFVERERREWIRRVGASPSLVLSTHVVDADRIYDALARGEIGYDDFVARLVAHPVLAAQRPEMRDDLDDPERSVATIFALFLGRLPDARERADFGALLRPFRRVVEPRCADGYYTDREIAIVDPHACWDPVRGDDACTSIELGAAVTVAVPPDAAPYGLEVDCEGLSTRDDVYYYERFHGGAVPEPIQIELERPGRLLATRSELWDRAAELALSRLLGWWGSTPDEPATLLPEVRRVTAEWFRARTEHDLRDLYAFVLTSILGSASAIVTGAGDLDRPRSPWSIGPTRWMDAEQYIDSLEAALGRELGLCDPHTDEPTGIPGGELADRLRAPEPDDFYGFGENLYYAWGRALGSCAGPQAPPASAGLAAIFAQPAIADRVCGLADAHVLPDGVDPSDRSDAAVERVAADLFARMLLRAPSAPELEAIHAAADTCFAAADCDLDALARETCAAIARSTELSHY